MKKTLFFRIMLILCCTVFSMGAFAQALLVEDFDYTVGTTLVSNGWNITGTSLDNPILVGEGLAFNGYAGSGIGGAALVNNNYQDVNKGFAPVTSGVIYVAFMFKTGSSNSQGYFLHLSEPDTTGACSTSKFSARVFVSGNGTAVGIAQNSSFPSGNTLAVTPGTTYLGVIEHDYSTGYSKLYVFNQFPTSQPTSGYVTSATSTTNTAGFVCLRQYNNNQDITVDGIRVATTWADAVAASSTNQAAAPTFSVPGGMVSTDNVSITLSSSTPNASIYYTLDGTTPSSTSTPYTTAITLTQTTTVKAIAYATGFEASAVSTATYTFPTPVANIAAFKAAGAADNTQTYRITGDVTVIAQKGHNNLYLQDATGGLVLYESGNSLNFQTGDVFQGTLMGTYATYQNLPELIPQGTLTVVPGGTVTAVNVTAGQLLSNFEQYACNLINIGNVTFLEGATYTPGTSGTNIRFTQGNDTITLYNAFATLDTSITVGETFNITGVAMQYVNNTSGTVTYEIAPRANADLHTSIPQPTLSILSPANGANYSTLDTLSINLNIQNFTLGMDGLLKIESNLLTLAGLSNPAYLNATTWAMFQNYVFSPLPAGTFSATVSLVGLDSLPLTTPVTATTSFTVVAPTLATPTITVTGNEAETAGSYYFTANVAIAAENGATIHYTTDGTTPDASSTTYSTPFDVTTSCTVKAIAMKANYANSDIASAIIVIDTPTVAAPAFEPASGVFTDSVVVSISCTDTAASIRYTTDGSEPTETSTLYESPITLTATATLKAKAFKANWHASQTIEATYTIVNDAILTVTPTTLTFNSTTLTNNITVSAAYINGPIVLTCNDTHFTLSNDTLTNGNSTVTVTFNGTEPATGIITITGDTLSAQVSLSATVTLPTPTFTPASGATDTLIEVVIACANANAAIYYTTDGAMPDAHATLYNTPIVLNTVGDHTIKAIAILNGWDNSEVATATYTITAPVPPTPIFNDSIIYTTGFEASEDFVAPSNQSNYQNDDVVYYGPAAQQWGVYHGIVSTSSVISGAQDIQMRTYHSSTSPHLGHLGYTFTNFDLYDVTRVTFQAKSTNNYKVAVSYSIDGGANYIAGDTIALTSTPENYTFVVSETGEFASVRLRFTMVNPETVPASGNSQFIIDSVVIYGIPGIVHEIVDMPVISPNSGFVYDSTQVSITCATEGASIYYTTDGTNPDMNSTLYSAPFTVSSTTTVKAKAFKTGYDASNVASATYTFPVEVASIAEFKAANSATNSTVYKITGDVTFVFENGANFYIQDATGGLLIYDNQNNDIITRTYTEGDVISGGVCGTYTLYNGLVELVPTRDLAAASSNSGTVSPVMATIADISTNYDQLESKLVKLTDVTFTQGGTYTTSSASNMTIEQNGETMQVRNVFKTLDMTIPAGQEADVTGFVLRYNTNYQIAPRDNDDIEFITVEMDTVETPVITVNPLTNDMVSVTITCATEGASIYYTMDETTPTENSTFYPEAFAMVDMEFTVKAIAVKEGMVSSEIATFHYIPVGIREHEANVTIYPNPTIDQCTIRLENSIMDEVRVFDLSGKMVRSMKVNDQEVKIDMSQLSSGTYFIRILSDKNVTTHKIMKQ